MVLGVFVASSPAILAACFQSRGEAPRRQVSLSDDSFSECRAFAFAFAMAFMWRDIAADECGR